MRRNGNNPGRSGTGVVLCNSRALSSDWGCLGRLFTNCTPPLPKPGLYLADLEVCNFSWSVLWMLMYFAILLCIDNGPCKHICSIVEGNVVCSCLSGYTIMADGVSCEGKRFGFTTETWFLWTLFIDVVDLIPLGVSLRVPYFQRCELQGAAQRPSARRNTRSASQTPPAARLSSAPVLWGLQVKASLDLCSFPLTFQAFFSALWVSLLTTIPPQGLSAQLWTCSFSSWEREQLAGCGHICCPEEPPRSCCSAPSPLWLGFISACLANLNSVKLYSCEERAIVSLTSSMGFTWHWSSGRHNEEQGIPNCSGIFHIIYILNGRVWVVTKDIFAQERFGGQNQCPVTYFNYKSVHTGAVTASSEMQVEGSDAQNCSQVIHIPLNLRSYWITNHFLWNSR